MGEGPVHSKAAATPHVKEKETQREAGREVCGREESGKEQRRREEHEVCWKCESEIAVQTLSLHGLRKITGRGDKEHGAHVLASHEDGNSLATCTNIHT